jgi:hypothetical protein
MNFLRNSYFKKISTSILLVLFISIHAIKAFHTHNFPAVQSSFGKNTSSVHTSFFCAICDFQIAKDSDAEVATINISAPIKFIVSFYNYSLLELTNFSVTSSVRGPPVAV